MLWLYFASSILGIICWSNNAEGLVDIIKWIHDATKTETAFLKSPVAKRVFASNYAVHLVMYVKLCSPAVPSPVARRSFDGYSSHFPPSTSTLFTFSSTPYPLPSYPLHFATGTLGLLFVLHRFVAVAVRLDPIKQAQLLRVSKVAVGCVFTMYSLECISVWCAVGYLVQAANMMPATAANERILVRTFNAYSNSYAASFVFESASMVTMLGLFAVGYSITAREFKKVEDALHLASLKSTKSGYTAKAHVLEQGVHEMVTTLSATTAVVFCSFVIQTAYDLLWTVATFGDVFKVQCDLCYSPQFCFETNYCNNRLHRLRRLR
jgi:hypothetical protein